jgi:hypothetical protein
VSAVIQEITEEEEEIVVKRGIEQLKECNVGDQKSLNREESQN